MHNGDSKGYAEKHRSNSKKAFQDSPLTFSNTPKATNFPPTQKNTRLARQTRDYQDDTNDYHCCEDYDSQLLEQHYGGGMVETVEDHSSVEVTGLTGLQIKVYVPTSIH